MSRIETGQVSVHHGDVTDLLDIYGVSDEDLRAELGDMARQSRLKGWWHRHRDTFKRGFDSYIGLENDARGLRTYQSQVVPGLLQTEAYARAVINTIAAGQTPADILDKKIAVRLSRQELLIRTDPMTLHVILDEAVLRRDVGGAETMAEQRDALISMGKLPNITLQVLPFSAGAHVALDGEFSILEFPDSKDPDVVYLEQKTSGLVLEDPSELDCYSMMFTRLSAQALDPDQSAAFIASLT
jgi:hypothetical protein